ncbi:MAG: preprotein translocase subunit SecY [Candidatus Pacebacteria bacterium]|jgi:preprotein translocase subunit SecY|nr:preprotein translocase subunit SecY [Candidatus Paceibacterota bacterium]
MQTFFRKLKIIFTDRAIRNRVLFVFGILVIFRLLAAVPIPGVDQVVLQQFFANNQFLGLLNIFSGGGLANLSIVMLGVGPFITASIIMQLMTVMSPKMKSLYTEEGEAGRAKFTQYSRMLSLPLAILQAFGFLTLLESQGVIQHLSVFDFALNVVLVVAGATLLMWLGELVTEYGIGNGVSLIIFAGILAGLPATVSQLIFSFDMAQLPLYIGFGFLALLVIFAVVIMTEAERVVPVTHAKQSRGNLMLTTRGNNSYLPLRLNQAGVIPIIFALSILLFPQMILNILSAFNLPWVADANAAVTGFMNDFLLYGIVYFVLVFLFTFFYTAVTFDPDAVAKNLQRSGAFIPGIRPGDHTAEYLGNLITRLTLVGALFLAVVAVLPIGLQVATGIAALAIGGTAILIVVNVVLDLIRRLDAQVSLREY